MSEAWMNLPFSELYAEPSRNGLTVPKAQRGSGVPMVNMRELFAYDFITDQATELVPLASGTVDKWLLRDGDLLFGRRSLTLEGAGKCSIVLRPPHSMVFESSLIRVRLDQRRACPRFFFYLFRSRLGRNLIETIVEQVAVAGIRSSDLARLQVPVPPIREQRRIAGVLGAFDDLIDTNQRLQETLAHQRSATMGLAVSPASNSTTFGEIAELVRVQVSPTGVAPSTPYLGLEHFAEDASGLLGVGLTDGLESMKWRFEAGDVLYSKLRPYFRKVVRPNFDGVCSTEIWVLRPKGDVSSEYLEWVASTQEFTDFAMAGSTGTRMPRANWDHVRTFAVSKPSGKDFVRAVAANRVMWEQYWALHDENEALGRTRDELLPVLLSGQVRVEDVAA